MVKKSEPKVTVVTITFNLIKAGRKQSFVKCLESVHSQNYQNIEHLIIDGASTDGTHDLLKEYEKKGYIKYKSKKDNGIWDAMNKGIDAATGKYITFLNSDDFYCCDDAVSSSVEILEKEHGDIVSGYANSVTLGTGKKCAENCFEWDSLPFGQFPCHQTVFYKTDELRKIGKYDEDYLAADNVSFATFIKSGKKTCVNRKYIVNFSIGGYSGDNEVQKKVVAEYSEYFYKNFGKKLHLTKQESENLQCQRFLYIPLQEAVSLGLKLKNQEWMQNYFMRLTNHISQQNKKVIKMNPRIDYTEKHNLFSVLPLFSLRKKYNVMRVLLFGFIPLLKIKPEGHKVYLCSVLPLFSNVNNKISLFGIPVLYKKEINKNYTKVQPGVYSFSGKIPFVSDGLYSPESFGVWSKDEKTRFYISTDRKCTATFDVNPFMVNGKRDVTVCVNSHKYKYLFESGKPFPTISVKLPKSKKIILSFVYDVVKSPKECNISEDDRRFSIGFKKVEIKGC